MVVLSAVACSTAAPAPVEPTPNIDATVEAKLAQERAVDATVEARSMEEKTAQPTPYPTYTPWLTSTPIPVPTATLMDVLEPSETPGTGGFAILDESAATWEAVQHEIDEATDAAQGGRD